MVDTHFKHTKGRPLLLNGGLPSRVSILRRIFDSQFLNGRPLFLLVLQHADPTKKDHASEIGGIFLRDNWVLVNSTEGRLAVALNCVQLVTRPGTVEIDVITVIYIADRESVWVIVIT